MSPDSRDANPCSSPGARHLAWISSGPPGVPLADLGRDLRTCTGTAEDWQAIAADPPALLICDLAGAEAAATAAGIRNLRARGIRCPVLALAGPGSEIACMEALKAGANDYLLHPLTAGDLAERVRALLAPATHDPLATGDLDGLLNESEIRFRSLAEHAPVGIFLCSPKGEALFFNRSWYRLAGLAPATALGRGWLHALHPDDRERVLARWEQAVDRKLSSEHEFRFLRPDGTVCWIQGNAVILHDRSGQVTGFVGSCVDITSRKQSEELLLTQRRILENIAADADLPAVLTGIALAVERQFDRPAVASILLVDDSGARFTGGASPGLPDDFPAAAEGLPIAAILGDRSLTAAPDRLVFTADLPTDPRWAALHGQALPSELQAIGSLPIRGSDGRLLGTLSAYFHDSREPGEREESVLRIFADAAAIAIGRRSSRLEMDHLSAEAARRMRLYETFLSVTPDLAYVFDRDHRFIYANRALLTMWGKTAEEAIGRNCLELGYEPWHAAMHDREIDLAAATRAPVRGEVPFNGTNGRRIYDYIFTPVIGADGEVEAIAGTTRDVTERKGEEQRAIFLSELGHQLASMGDEAGIIHAVTAAVGRLFECHRCYFVECFETEDRLAVSANFVRDAAPSLAGEYRLSEFGGQEWWASYCSGDFSVADVTTDPLTCERADSYLPLGVRSYAVQPYRSDFSTTVVLAVTEDRPRTWTAAELVILDSVVARVWPLIERARTGEELRESRRTTRLVADHTPALISYVDHDLVFRFVNGFYQEWFGLGPEQLVGRPLREFLKDPTFTEHLPYLQRALQGEPVRFEGVARHRSLGLRDLELSFVPETEAEESKGGFYVMAFDITERKRAEQTLRRQTERLRLLWEAAGIILTSEDPDRMLQSLFAKIGPHLEADTYLNFMVAVPGELMELRSSAGIDAADLAQVGTIRFGQAICGAVAESCQPLSAAFIQDATDARTSLVRGLGLRTYACNPLVAEGRLLGTLSFASRRRDEFSADELEFMETISHYVTGAYTRLALLEDLRESDRRKDHFLATLAHELRNPLAPILTGLEVIRSSAHDPGAITRVADMMQRQTSQIVHLIDDLLDMSRITTGKIVLKKTLTPLIEILQSALEASEPAIREYRHELTVDLPAPGLIVDADPHRIAQVVSNLLSNAAKYTPPGGRIRLEAGASDDQTAFIRVIDNGLGIDPASQAKIFNLFEQDDHGRNDGLGIGLTLVKSLAEMHGGSVTVESAGVGHGSSFTVQLPASLESAPAATVAPEPSAPSIRPRKKVLVVDDGKSAADVLVLFFEMEGMETAVAYDGETAVAIAAEFRPDLVCMDLGMPRMDGFEAARHMRNLLDHAVLIALSGWGREEDKRRTTEAGFDGHLVKPVSPTDLRAIVARYLAE